MCEAGRPAAAAAAGVNRALMRWKTVWSVWRESWSVSASERCAPTASRSVAQQLANCGRSRVRPGTTETPVSDQRKLQAPADKPKPSRRNHAWKRGEPTAANLVSPRFMVAVGNGSGACQARHCFRKRTHLAAEAKPGCIGAGLEVQITTVARERPWLRSVQLVLARLAKSFSPPVSIGSSRSKSRESTW